MMLKCWASKNANSYNLDRQEAKVGSRLVRAGQKFSDETVVLENTCSNPKFLSKKSSLI